MNRNISIKNFLQIFIPYKMTNNNARLPCFRWSLLKTGNLNHLSWLKKDVSFGLNRVPPQHLLTSPFGDTPLPPPWGRRLLWMVPNECQILATNFWILLRIWLDGQMNRTIEICRYYFRFSVEWGQVVNLSHAKSAPFPDIRRKKLLY